MGGEKTSAHQAVGDQGRKLDITEPTYIVFAMATGISGYQGLRKSHNIGTAAD